MPGPGSSPGNAADWHAGRVLFVDLAHRFGGASARCLNFLESMPPGVAALAALEGTPSTAHARDLGLEVHTLGTHKIDPLIPRRLHALVTREDFEVVDTQNPQARLWAGVSRAQGQATTVSTFNSWPMDEFQGGIRGRLYGFLDASVRNAFDHFIAVSDEIAQRLKDARIDGSAISIVPSAITIQTPGGTHDRQALVQRYALPENSLLCVSVGRLVLAKGYPYWIEAVEALLEDGIEVTAMIVGGGKLRNVLAQDVRQRGLESNIRLLGELSSLDAKAVSRAADVFVMPSLTEGTPLAVLEAAAAARAIVATNVGGIPSVLQDGREALLVSPGSPRDLVSAVKQLAASPSRREQLGRAARDAIACRYATEVQLANLQNAYLLAGERRRRIGTAAHGEYRTR